MKSSTIASTVESLTPEQERCRRADPRNPKPGQVWERGDELVSVIGTPMDSGPFIKSTLVSFEHSEHGWMSYFEFQAWSMPTCWPWRRRKHWAKCVEWK